MPSILPLMALNSLYCGDVPLSNYSLTHPLTHAATRIAGVRACVGGIYTKDIIIIIIIIFYLQYVNH